MMKTFDEYIREGVIIKQRIDLARSKSLIEEAENRKKFLKDMLTKIKLNDDNANYFIEQSYDILMEMIRAKMLINGFRTTGGHAHEAEVSFLSKINIPDHEVRFADELRYFRNGIKYYGKKCDKEYAEKTLSFLEKIQQKLK